MGPGHTVWTSVAMSLRCDDALIILLARPLEASVGHLRYHPGIMSLRLGLARTIRANEWPRGLAGCEAVRGRGITSVSVSDVERPQYYHTSHSALTIFPIPTARV